MKNFLFVLTLLGTASTLVAQDHPVPMSPDLSGRVERDGNDLIVTIINEPRVIGTVGGQARASVATLKLNAQTVTIPVPAMEPNTLFEKRVPIPTNLGTYVLNATLKVNTTNTVQEPRDNNTFTTIFRLRNFSPNGPDLAPMEFEGGGLNTRTEGAARFFYVRNNGNEDAPVSKARFTYKLANGQKQEIIVPVPAIRAGQKAEVRFSPGTCSSTPSSGDCNFEVEVDAGNNIEESNEDNNIVSGQTAG